MNKWYLVLLAAVAASCLAHIHCFRQLKVGNLSAQPVTPFAQQANHFDGSNAGTNSITGAVELEMLSMKVCTVAGKCFFTSALFLTKFCRADIQIDALQCIKIELFLCLREWMAPSTLFSKYPSQWPTTSSVDTA
jgi:hypothetical protein